MQNHDLVVSDIIEHAARFHADSGVSSVTAEGDFVQLSWKEIRDRARSLAVALQGLGVRYDIPSCC